MPLPEIDSKENYREIRKINVNVDPPRKEDPAPPEEFRNLLGNEVRRAFNEEKYEHLVVLIDIDSQSGRYSATIHALEKQVDRKT